MERERRRGRRASAAPAASPAETSSAVQNEPAQYGGQLNTATVVGQGKTTPDLTSKAVVQNDNSSAIKIKHTYPKYIPRDIEDEEESQFGGQLNTAQVVAPKVSRPSLIGKAVVQNDSDTGIRIRPRVTSTYGGQLDTAMVTADRYEQAQDGGTLNTAVVEAKGKNRRIPRGRAMTGMTEEDPIRRQIRKRRENMPKYGGELDTAIVMADAPAQDGGQLNTAEVVGKRKDAPDLRGRAVVQNDESSPIKIKHTYPKYNPADYEDEEEESVEGGELKTAVAEAPGKKTANLTGRAEVQNDTSSAIKIKHTYPKYNSKDYEDEEEEGSVDGGELPVANVVADRKRKRQEAREARREKRKGGAEEVAEQEPEAKDGGTLKTATVEAPGKSRAPLTTKAEILNDDSSAIRIKHTYPKYNPTETEEEDNEESATTEQTTTQTDQTTTEQTEGEEQINETIPQVTKEAEGRALPELKTNAQILNDDSSGIRIKYPERKPDTSDNEEEETEEEEKEEEVKTEEEEKEEEKTEVDKLGDVVKNLEKEIAKNKEDDEVANRRGRNMRLIAGISDGLTALANLVGTSKGATHTQFTGALGHLTERLDALRKERAAELKDKRDRLDRLSKEEREMRLAYAREAESKRRWDEEMAFKKQQEDTDNEQWDKNFAFQEQKEKTENEHWDKEFAFNREKWDKDFGLREKQVTAEIDLANKKYEEAKRHNKATEAAAWSNYALNLKRFEEEKKNNAYSIEVGKERIFIPKYGMNTGNIDPLFNSLPEEYKKLAQGARKEHVDPITREITYGEPLAPTLEAKLGAIATYAQKDPKIAEALKAMANKKNVFD